MTNRIQLGFYDRIGRIGTFELYQYDGVMKDEPEYVLHREGWGKIPLEDGTEMGEVIHLLEEHRGGTNE